MQPNLFKTIILPVFFCFINTSSMVTTDSLYSLENEELFDFKTVEDIPVPEGFQRVKAHSFGEWLRRRPLKKDRQVYLYNGRLKANQQAQYAVLDIPIGTRDLQQCADAVMRLRAEYLFEQGQFDQIVFRDNAHRVYPFKPPYIKARLERYLEQVYAACGTLSLEAALKPVSRNSTGLPGDVWIHGGSPGHAAIILDLARDQKGRLVALIANSYMPAQSIHIVRNIQQENLSPWILIEDQRGVILPEWQFYAGELRRF